MRLQVQGPRFPPRLEENPQDLNRQQRPRLGLISRLGRHNHLFPLGSLQDLGLVVDALQGYLVGFCLAGRELLWSAMHAYAQKATYS